MDKTGRSPVGKFENVGVSPGDKTPQVDEDKTGDGCGGEEVIDFLFLITYIEIQCKGLVSLSPTDRRKNGDPR
jgi:hypothetical protein